VFGRRDLQIEEHALAASDDVAHDRRHPFAMNARADRS
jgi:hypothetical protein